MAIRSFAALLALLSCTAPLHAQTIRDPALTGAGPVAMGSFVGARLRIPLGGTRDGGDPIRAGLTVAPMQRSGGTGDVAPVWRIGDGLEFGFTSDAPVAHVSLAGQYLGPARYAPGGKAAKARANLSDGETIAAVAVGLALLAGGGLLLALDAAGDPDPCEPGGCNNN